MDIIAALTIQISFDGLDIEHRNMMARGTKAACNTLGQSTHSTLSLSSESLTFLPERRQLGF